MNYLYLIIVTVLVSFFVSCLVWVHGYCWRSGIFSIENSKSFFIFYNHGNSYGCWNTLLRIDTDIEHQVHIVKWRKKYDIIFAFH